jgi:S-adenosylmethionine synthetase
LRNIIVERLRQTPLEKQRLEIVERKGLGHPDYICDAVMEQISLRLSKEYLEKAGTILHHNVDKSLLVAGQSELRFGGGIVKQPMLFVFGDRATTEFDGVKIDVEEIAINVAKEWFRKNMRFVDPDKHVKYQVELKPGSAGLVDIFKRKGKVLGANDTSAAVGYAPMTRTEKIVLKTEQFLNSKEFKQRHPESGEDIKVMGSRNNNNLNLTISMAFVDRFITAKRNTSKKRRKSLKKSTNLLKPTQTSKNQRPTEHVGCTRQRNRRSIPNSFGNKRRQRGLRASWQGKPCKRFNIPKQTVLLRGSCRQKPGKPRWKNIQRFNIQGCAARLRGGAGT